MGYHTETASSLRSSERQLIAVSLRAKRSNLGVVGLCRYAGWVLNQSMIALPVAFQTPWRAQIWPSTSSRCRMRQGWPMIHASSGHIQKRLKRMREPKAGEVMTAVQTAMLADLPYPRLRDAVIAHPTMAEGLGPLF